MRSHISISTCDICKHLSSHNYADLMSGSIPENIALLAGNSPADRPAEDIIECPICGTFYSYTYACGFTENDIVLRRVSPIEAGHEVDVAYFQQGLVDSHDDTRGYAAQCLVEYYLSEGRLKDADSLINNKDAVIRSHAEASRNYYLARRTLNE